MQAIQFQERLEKIFIERMCLLPSGAGSTRAVHGAMTSSIWRSRGPRPEFSPCGFSASMTLESCRRGLAI